MQLATFAPDCIDQVYLIAAMGMSDEEMCTVFGVSMGKLVAWRRMYSDFDSAIARGRLLVDAKVVEALYRRAVGYDVNAEVRTTTYTDEDGEGETTVRRSVTHIPPDVGAAKFWLQNRQRETWKERREVEVNVVHTLGARLEAVFRRMGQVPSLAPDVIDVELVQPADGTAELEPNAQVTDSEVE